MIRDRMTALLAFYEAKFSQSHPKLPQHGAPQHAVKHILKTGEDVRTKLRVARTAKKMGRPDAAKLAVKQARSLGKELAGHRAASRTRAHSRATAAYRMKHPKLAKAKDVAARTASLLKKKK